MNRASNGKSLPALNESVAATVAGDDVTHVIFILDRSGSMSGKEEDVIGGFNSYVEKLRAEPSGQVGISYLRFDGELELIWNDVPLADVPAMTHDTYSVRGNTALLDAVGMTLSTVKDDPAHRYVAITHTDGQENASKEWTAEKVKELIERLEAKGNWTFAFFGEGVDAWSQAQQYGYTTRSSMAYSQADTRDVYDAEARAMNVMRAKKMRAAKAYAAATEALMRTPSISDDDVEKILEGEEERE